jgi:hypothetical protein
MLRSGWWTPVRTDAALAGGVYAVEMMMYLAGPAEWYAYAGPWLPVTTAVSLVPIVLRRRWTWLAVGLTAALIAIGTLDKTLWSAQGVSLWVVAYTLAAYETWWRAALTSAALWLANDLAFVVALRGGTLVDANGKPLISLSAGLLVNAGRHARDLHARPYHPRPARGVQGAGRARERGRGEPA